jgi:two-component sensor histidine kinase
MNPTRPFLGTTVRAVLLRKFVPMAFAVVFIFVCVKEVMLTFFPPGWAYFFTLVMSSSIISYLLLRSSHVVATQLEKALEESEQNNIKDMKAALQEKEVLLKEVHHRVKNNLQVISSLLRLQSETVQNKEMAALFLDSQDRVRSMAMVHEYLYKSSDLARINFPAYAASLVRNLYRTFGLSTSEYQPNVEVDDVLLSLDVAVPCGLLLTELVSNAAKYAYPEKKAGPIQVRFRSLPEGLFELSVADQGVGFPKNFDWMKSDSLGLRLMRLLTEQLQGQIQVENHVGLKFIVTFKDGG